MSVITNNKILGFPAIKVVKRQQRFDVMMMIAVN